MMAEKIHMAASAREWLVAHGSHIAGVYIGVARPTLEITCPPSALIERAVRISEHDSKGVRSVWMARFNGCNIIWR